MTKIEKKTMWKVRFFPVWQEGREALWLKSMSANGWHLKKVSFLVYEFEEGEPADYEYALDFRFESRTDMQEYRGLIEDSGWQYIDHMAGWQYFRIEAEKAAAAEIYSDAESLRGMYWRILAVLGISGFPLFILFMNGAMNRSGLTETSIIYIVYSVIALLLYSTIRVLLLILRRKEIS